MTITDWSASTFFIPIPITITDWSVNAFLIMMFAMGLFGVFGGLYQIYGGQPGPRPRQMAVRGGLEIAAAAASFALLRTGIVAAGWPVIVAVLTLVFMLDVYFRWSNSRNPFKVDDDLCRDNWTKTRAKGRMWFILPNVVAMGLGIAWSVAFLKILFWDYIPLFVGALVIIAFMIWGYRVGTTAWTENERKYFESSDQN